MSMQMLPDGIEWPMFEDGSPVCPGDRTAGTGSRKVEAIAFHPKRVFRNNGVDYTRCDYGTPFHRADSWDAWYGDLADYMYGLSMSDEVGDFADALERFGERAKELGRRG